MTFCQVMDMCVVRSAHRKRRALVIVDNARIHRPKTSNAVKALLARRGKHLRLVYVPAYAPDEEPQEKFWGTW
jgi:transposase